MLTKKWHWVMALLMGIFAMVFMINHVYAADNSLLNYTNDSNGIYPTASWQPTGQTTVINHQGGFGTQVDGNKSWSGDSSDTKNSYLKFGADQNKPDYAIRKYAKETSTQGLYDVYLNVKGSAQQDIKPVDIVLVVDMSGSMEQGTGRAEAVRQGVKNFMSSISQAGVGKYVNVGLVGYSSPGRGYRNEEVGMASLSDAHQNQINNALSGAFNGGTYTQDGIQRGANMLSSDNSGNRKMMILLTDGVPTFSNKVTSATTIDGTIYATGFSTAMDQPGNTSKLQRSYTVGSGQNRLTISDTFPATLGQAKIAKDNGAEIHTLGIQLSNDGNYLTAAEVRNRISKTASPGMYQDANSADDIVTYLNSQSDNIINNFNNVANGTIADPLGKQFIYANPSLVDVTSVGSKSIDNDHLPKAVISGNQLNVSNITLGDDQEIQVHYQVHINTETNDFKPDYWYQMNGNTTFKPKGDEDTTVQFGIPSAKAPSTTLNVKKEWHILGDEKVPDSITYTVSRDSVTDANNWTTATGTLTKADNWQQEKIDHLLVNNQEVALPKFNNAGQNFNYQVKSEVDVPGFVSTIDGQDNTYTITNTNLGVTVKKFAANSQNSLSGANFKLTQYTDKWAAVDTSFTPVDFNGVDTLKSIKPGYYEVIEEKAPQGYDLKTSRVRFQVTDDGKFLNENGQEITATTTPNNDGFYVYKDKSGAPVLTIVQYDALKLFDLSVVKVDASSGKHLANAEFRLTGDNNVNVTGKSDDDGHLTFTDLKPGQYVLEETKAPSGYHIMAKKLNITIDNQGKVSFSDSTIANEVTLSQDDKHNQITVTIKNSENGVLPKTGGTGIWPYILTGMIIFISSLVFGYYGYRHADGEV
ncbi:SpaA isopeptide-forming pilin-related protein [Weissella paramesenteroides]|uniref:SpaA isopeptide-forming pilin-related protein n=1 Tax=Weissella paramesenteroides TaxID=1249 RepID=UPI002E7B706A|nr:SpaA isopeptide-forming pilin-related protein [Weissella paramesenteroides]WPQ68181.1 SpaA isopeptide-forming pilin-related protein [Weissella paramesenteroides]